jgi:hypothetical protein
LTASFSVSTLNEGTFDAASSGGWITLNIQVRSGWPTLCDVVFCKGWAV